MSSPVTQVAEKPVLVLENADGAVAGATTPSTSASETEKEEAIGPLHGPFRILSEEDAYHVLGFSFPSIKKWSILTAIFIVQISMNFNAAIYGNAVSGMSKEFDVTESKAKYGQMIFLVT